MEINNNTFAMSIKKYISVIIPILLISCYERERNCTDFKTGTFTSEITLNEETITSTFERNDSIQIETFEGVIDTFSLRWTNDCEYIIKNIKPKNMLEKKAVSIKIFNKSALTSLLNGQSSFIKIK